MKVKTVSYCKTFNIGSYQSEKIGVEIDVEENETPEQCLSAAKSMVATFFTQSNPQLNYQDQETKTTETIIEFGRDENNNLIRTEKYAQTIENQSLTQEQKIKQLISQATSIPELKQWELLSKNKQYPDLKELYNQRLKELTNAE